MFKTLKRNFLPFIIAFSALSVSASAAFYSVSGLSKLFAGASFEVMVMAGSLEVAKLVVASLLYQYWDTINKGLRAYLATATIILVLITSMGIYGFLSAAYQETYSKLQVQENQIEFIENKAQFYEDDIARYDIELARISENINILSSAKASGIQVRDTTSSTGFRQTISTTELRMASKRIETEEANRKGVQAKRQIAADSLQTFKLQILDLQNTSETAGELGPLQYLSGLTGTPMDKIINWLLLVIIFVFDPLAISLVVAANFAFDQARLKEEDDIEFTPRDSVWNDLDDDDDEIDLPNDELVNATEQYTEEVGYVDDILDRVPGSGNPNIHAMDATMDKENAAAWGELADELAKGIAADNPDDEYGDLPWEKNPEDEIEEADNEWLNDPDVQDFLERADEPGPWSEEDDKIHTIGGLTNDKEGSFMEFQKKQEEYDAYVDRHEPGSWLKTPPEEEFDEDHALDQVLNDMVEDMTEDDIDEIANAKFEVEDTYGNIEVIDPKEVKPEVETTTAKPVGKASFTPNEPTSVGVTVKDIIEPVPSIVEKVPTPHLPDEARGVEPPSEDELFDQAMREQAEKDKKEFLKKRDGK